jgi:hypothetical protein
MSDWISREAAIAVVSLRPDRYTTVTPVYADRIRALPAVQPRVKPLEFIYGRAESATGVYVIESGKATGGGRWWAWAHNPDESDGFFMWQHAERAESEEAAKAAAQADYDARILSALEPAGQPRVKPQPDPFFTWPPVEPQPDAAAIREAALREVLEALAAEVDQMRRKAAKANNANKMRRELEADGAFEILAVLAGMIDNTGKEVMPDAASSARGSSDIGPGDQAVAGAAGPFRFDPEDWTEDYAHENGNYMCLCMRCNKQFFGHKRRVVCRVCVQYLPVAGAARTLLDVTCDCGKSRPCYPANECRWPVKAHNAVAGAAPVTVQEAARVLKENVYRPQYQDAIQAAMLHGLSPHKAHVIIGGFLHALAQKGDSHE